MKHIIKSFFVAVVATIIALLFMTILPSCSKDKLVVPENAELNFSQVMSLHHVNLIHYLRCGMELKVGMYVSYPTFPTGLSVVTQKADQNTISMLITSSEVFKYDCTVYLDDAQYELFLSKFQ